MPGPTDDAEPAGARNNTPDRVAFCRLKSIGAPNGKSFVAQWLAYVHPCQRFTRGLAFGNKNCKTALADAGKIGAIDYTELNAHLVAAMCLEDMGDKKESALQHEIFLGLVDSIPKSGDGHTPKTAYRVVTLDEEYTLLTILQLESNGQALIQEDGHSYDRFDVSADDTKEESTIFFEIDPIFTSLARDLHTP